MYSSIIFQGKELDPEMLGGCSNPDILRLLDDYFVQNTKENGRKPETPLILNLFSDVSIPPRVPGYIDRILGQKIWINSDNMCLKNLLNSSSTQNVSCCMTHFQKGQIYAIRWKDFDDKRHDCGFCKNIPKVATLLSKDIFLKSIDQQQVFVVEIDETDDTEASNQFDKLSSKAKEFVVHWLQAWESGYIWRKTSAACKTKPFLASPMHSLKKQETDLLQPMRDGPQENILCFSGIAGMGKTALLTNIANNLKTIFPNRIILVINLEHFENLLKVLFLNVELDIITFIDCIIAYFHITYTLEQHILKCLMSAFVASTTEANVELLMDGFDKMSPRSRMTLLHFLKREKKLSRGFRVWLFTRPHLKSIVEKQLTLVAYDLQPFDGGNVLKYWEDSCAQCMDLGYSMGDPSERVKLAETTLSHLTELYLEMNFLDLCYTPLYSKAIMCFMNQTKVENPLSLCASDVLATFMDNVKEHYLRGELDPEKLQTKVKEFSKKNQKCVKYAAHLLLQDNSNKPVDMENNLFDLGIITKNDSEQCVFVNKTMQEYILANYYATTDINADPFLLQFFQYYVLCDDNCYNIRKFLNERLVHYGIETDVLTSLTEVVREIMVKGYDLTSDTVDHDQIYETNTILDMAISDNNLEIAKLIIGCFQHNPKECKRLIKRKAKTVINNFCNIQPPVDYKLPLSNHTGLVHIETSALGLAIMWGDVDLVHTMYTILQDDDDGFGAYTSLDLYHFSPMHLAVIGCNWKVLTYLSKTGRAHPNQADLCGNLPHHLELCNLWVFKLTINPLFSGNDNHSKIYREILICKYFKDTKTDFVKDFYILNRSDLFSTMSSHIIRRYTKALMRKGENFRLRSCCPSVVIQYKNSSDKTLVELLNDEYSVGSEKKILAKFFLSLVGTGVNVDLLRKSTVSSLQKTIRQDLPHIVNYFVSQNKKVFDWYPHQLHSLLKWQLYKNKLIMLVRFMLQVPYNCTKSKQLLIEFGHDVTTTQDGRHWIPLLHNISSSTSSTEPKTVQLFLEKTSSANTTHSKDEPIHVAIVVNDQIAGRLYRNEKLPGSFPAYIMYLLRSSEESSKKENVTKSKRGSYKRKFVENKTNKTSDKKNR